MVISMFFMGTPPFFPIGPIYVVITGEHWRVGPIRDTVLKNSHVIIPFRLGSKEMLIAPKWISFFPTS